MDPFKTFVAEKKAYGLSAQENQQVEDTFSAYERYFGSQNLSVYNAKKRFSDVIKDDRMLINTIKYFDHKTKKENYIPVYVSFEKFNADAAHEQHENVIELYYSQFDKLPSLVKRNKIVHELIHAKQHYKTVSPEYARAVQKRSGAKTTIRSERGYFFSPMEYPVQISSIVHEMDRQYRVILQKIKSGSNVKFWDNQRKGFLRILEQFLRDADLNVATLPNYLQNEKRFLMTLFRNRNNPKYSKYYKDFKRKIYWYFQNLKQLKVHDREANNNL
jgi:hypothetical protein